MSKRLSPKQKGFVRDYLETGNATEAAVRNYNAKDRDTASSIGAENLGKPQIQALIDSFASRAASNIQKLADNAENESVKLNANKDMLDRSGFKPIDRTDVTSGGLPFQISEQVAKKRDIT